MDARISKRSRIGAAVAVALTGALWVALASATPSTFAGGEPPLLPDLVSIRPSDVVMPKHPKRDLVRISSAVANRGPGPLEIFPSPGSENCDGDGDTGNDRTAFQRVYTDSENFGSPGFFLRGQDEDSSEHQVGCMIFHPRHDHWHFDDFASYALVREGAGRTVARRSKVSFCVIDSAEPLPSAPPGKPKRPYYPPTRDGCDAASTQGLSVGWADLYRYYLPGQQLDVSGRKRGHFCLIATADPPTAARPDGRLAESNEANNTYRMRLFIAPGERIVRPARGHCKVTAK